MISVFLTVSDAAKDALIAELWEAGTTGITEENGALRAFFEDGLDASELERLFAEYNPHVTAEENRDWVKDCQAYWEPFAVGERFFLVPEWRDDEAPDGRIRLTTFPGMACGTGIHPATQLCLIAMEHHLQAGESLLDVGTGTGILAHGALLLGAKRVVACDIEQEAAVIARHNFEKTGAAIGVFAGSLKSVKSSAFDAAVANLNAATLHMLAADLCRVSARLIVSGFRENEMDRVKSSIGAGVSDALTMDGWACLVFRSMSLPPFF
ncbi:MAG: 50S ribosomal protein L11 methyltransferase [Bryobacteraceae bacterium]